ncbi:MAG: four helix bundle protein [Candidatus Muirbacterium halophilum]|nr:four helix bundle protein [Candidatus Muirbacterium halophilum]MCK9476398.1 four helix bundle protein [Candidatus Muirbacterium halophilum]
MANSFCLEKISSYRDLNVWKKSIDLTTEIYNTIQDYPENEKYGLISQICRSSVSIPSNIAEGWGRVSIKDFIRFLNIAKGSLCELETQLIISKNIGLISETQLSEFLKETEIISKMIYNMIKSLKSRDEK